MAILSTLLAVLVPILALPFWFFYFDITPKIAAFLTVVAATCCLVPLRSKWTGQSVLEKRITVLLLLQVLFLAIATYTSTNQALSISGSNWRRFGLITQLALLAWALIAANARNRRPLLGPLILRGIALSGTAIALYAVAQYFGIDPLLPSTAYHIGEGEWMIVRPPGTIGHADYLGCYLLFVVFLGGSLLVREQAQLWRGVGAAAAALGAFAIILSGTRSAILGLGLGVLLLAFRQRISLRRAVMAAAVAIALLGLFYISPAGQKLRSRSRWYQEDPRGGARPYLWADTVSMSTARPLTGWGPETFSAQFPRFQSLALAQAYPDFYHESPHNIFLDELVSKGFPAALCLLFACGAAALFAWRALARPADAPIGAAFLAATLCLQFNAFVLPTAFFYLLTALAVSLPAAETESGVQSRPRWQWLAAPALALLFAVFAVRYTAGDIRMAQVKRALEAGNIIDASNMYEQVRQWQPPGVNSDLYYSRTMHANVKRQPDLMLQVKAWQEAVQAAIRSTQFGEEPQNATYHLANLYASVNDRPDAEKSLRASIQIAPQWFKPHWILAQVLAAGGQTAEALVEARHAVTLDAGKHPEVAATLAQLTAKPQ